MDKRALQNDLVDAFVAYQYRLDNPFPSTAESKELRIQKYLNDPVFRAKVDALVGGVLHIVFKHVE